MAVYKIELHSGSRAGLRPLFELADDSATQLDAYMGLGRVLVAMAGDGLVGHLQLVETDHEGELEIKNMAVLETHQGQGIGRQLVQAAIELANAERVRRLLVATAAAGVGHLRFYQRVGFRMYSVERDAFTAATGYPADIVIDGIQLRDRVWFDLSIHNGQ
jgi:GNAT superfamily N-acetyltransferase